MNFYFFLKKKNQLNRKQKKKTYNSILPYEFTTLRLNLIEKEKKKNTGGVSMSR
jgi:hypothetical protein